MLKGVEEEFNGEKVLCLGKKDWESMLDFYVNVCIHVGCLYGFRGLTFSTYINRSSVASCIIDSILCLQRGHHRHSKPCLLCHLCTSITPNGTDNKALWTYLQIWRTPIFYIFLTTKTNTFNSHPPIWDIMDPTVKNIHNPSAKNGSNESPKLARDQHNTSLLFIHTWRTWSSVDGTVLVLLIACFHLPL